MKKLFNIQKILIFSFIFKLIFLINALINDATFLAADSTHYIKCANAIIENGSFIHFKDGLMLPELIRTPGYPIFVAILYKLFGNYVTFVIVSQIIVSLLSTYIFYLLIKTFFKGYYIPVIGSLVYAFEPINLALNYYVLSETIFQAILLIIMYLGSKIITSKESKSHSFLLLGLFCSIAIHIRPLMLYYPLPMMFGLLFYMYGKKIKFKSIMKNILLFAFPILIIVGGWMFRNHVLVGQFIFSIMPKINLISYKAPGILSLKHKISIYDAQKMIYGPIYMWQYASNNPGSDKFDLWTKNSINIIYNNPLVFVRVMLTGMCYTLLSPGDGQLRQILTKEDIAGGPLGDMFRYNFYEYIKKWIFNHAPLYFTFLYSLVFLIIIHCGLIIFLINMKNIDMNNWLFLFYLGTLLYFVITSGGLETNFRFRSPMIPSLLLLSFKGLTYFLQDLFLFKQFKIN